MKSVTELGQTEALNTARFRKISLDKVFAGNRLWTGFLKQKRAPEGALETIPD